MYDYAIKVKSSPMNTAACYSKHTLCLALHYCIVSHLYRLSPRDQCPHANHRFLFRFTEEPTFQNKSALKRHTYFMDVKCSKSKPFWIVELCGALWSLQQRRK